MDYSVALERIQRDSRTVPRKGIIRTEGVADLASTVFDQCRSLRTNSNGSAIGCSNLSGLPICSIT